MATRLLPEAAAGPCFALYMEELHEFLATNRLPFGSPADLFPVAERLRQPGPFSDDLSSLIRSFVLRQGGAMPHAQLLEILTLAIAGPEAATSPQQYREPLHQLLSFVAGVMRRPWNVPPGERLDAEIVRFPSDTLAPPTHAIPKAIPEPVQPEPGAEVAAAPITEPAAEPAIPEIPETFPPPSAIAAALVESKLMAPPPEPEAPRPDPVLFLRAIATPQTDPDAGPEPNRSSPLLRKFLIATAGAAALAAVLFFVYRDRKPADDYRIQPFAATTHPTATQAVPAASTQSAPTQPAPQPHLTGSSHPPKPSGYGEPLTSPPGHPPGAPLTWTYPETTDSEATDPEATGPATTPPDSATAPAASAAAAPAPPSAPASTQPQTTVPPAYVPYTPSSKDGRYAPYTPGDDSTQPAAPVVRQPAPHP
jgi:hypothetical protein